MSPENGIELLLASSIVHNIYITPSKNKYSLRFNL
jgi:hypothetical protein